MGLRPAEVRGYECSVTARTSQKSPPLPGSAIGGRTRGQPPPPGPGPGGLGPEPAGGGGFNAHWGGWGGPRGRPTRRGLRGGRGGGGVGLGCALGLVRWRVSLFGGSLVGNQHATQLVHGPTSPHGTPKAPPTACAPPARSPALLLGHGHPIAPRTGRSRWGIQTGSWDRATHAFAVVLSRNDGPIGPVNAQRTRNRSQ